MLITTAELADGRTVDVRISGEQIETVDADLAAEPDETVIDADGKLLLPGAIDAHVHFREPGYSHKETWGTATKSAAAGGVTTVVDMPNTNPPTTSAANFDAKAEYASHARVDYGINGGVTGDWDPDSLFEQPICALGEVFLADSTGDMGVSLDLFADAVEAAADVDLTVTVHAEDETLFDESTREADAGGVGREANAELWSAYRTAEAEKAAVERATEVGQEAGGTIHIAHTSTPEGIDAAVEGGATCEVCPHHLYLSRDDLADLGTYGRMNPPLRSEKRRKAVFERVADGTVDMIATDHAPHTREEKETSLWEAPSGVPGVETMVPLLLESARQGELSYERVEELVAHNPAEIFDLDSKGRIEEGYDADLVLVDPDEAREIRGADTHTNCDWTPFEGRLGVFPELTLLRGEVAYERTPGENADRSSDAEQFGETDGRNVRV
ncbi:dihydroorotase [Halohasta litchfieldiae]|uniref:Dihydroorotase n=1 Tax=Halohasta litchfieldiae TaxID=1073996 RepID=A0A1H6V260_9EURY|nr:dihydroorotase [Halohasta litchfieldiae]ATW87618.1 dihydroorotase [Halohasta litchfieldiae]SEI97986.1 dihydroorotase [Halohasta litchfieldiae]